MSIALHTVLTVYVYDTRGADPQRYASVSGVIQGCNLGMHSFCVSYRKPVEWKPKTAEAAGRGHADLPEFENELPAAVKAHLQDWLCTHRLSQPSPEFSVVVHRHYAHNKPYGMAEELAQSSFISSYGKRESGLILFKVALYNVLGSICFSLLVGNARIAILRNSEKELISRKRS